MTATKVLAHPPLGIEGFQRLAQLAPAPVVAIGALTPESTQELRIAGASGFAAIGDIVNANDPAERVRVWQQAPA